eukprot:XP_001701496.1 predicted protein [Chlamydomonas reinhardtii]
MKAQFRREVSADAATGISLLASVLQSSFYPPAVGAAHPYGGGSAGGGAATGTPSPRTSYKSSASAPPSPSFGTGAGEQQQPTAGTPSPSPGSASSVSGLSTAALSALLGIPLALLADANPAGVLSLTRSVSRGVYSMLQDWQAEGALLTAADAQQVLMCVPAAVTDVNVTTQVRATYKVPLSALGAETYAAACSSGASGSSVPGVAAGDTCSVLSPGSLGASTLDTGGGNDPGAPVAGVVAAVFIIRRCRRRRTRARVLAEQLEKRRAERQDQDLAKEQQEQQGQQEKERELGGADVDLDTPGASTVQDSGSRPSTACGIITDISARASPLPYNTDPAIFAAASAGPSLIKLDGSGASIKQRLMHTLTGGAGGGSGLNSVCPSDFDEERADMNTATSHGYNGFGGAMTHESTAGAGSRPPVGGDGVAGTASNVSGSGGVNKVRTGRDVATRLADITWGMFPRTERLATKRASGALVPASPHTPGIKRASLSGTSLGAAPVAAPSPVPPLHSGREGAILDVRISSSAAGPAGANGGGGAGTSGDAAAGPRLEFLWVPTEGVPSKAVLKRFMGGSPRWAALRSSPAFKDFTQRWRHRLPRVVVVVGEDGSVSASDDSDVE